ncbi:MAG: hypothetical protein LBR39_05145 [Coriobacteriales bacterium]|jgi:Tfp pilus assembly protein PilN|nr:hypothetical protein [Coriobacteriales bacterium]
MTALAKDINLYRVMTSRRASSASRKPLLLATAVLVAVGALIAAGIILYGLQMAEMRLDRDDLARYVNSTQTQQRYSESLRLQSQVTTTEQRANMVKQVLINLSSYPDLGGADFRKIRSYAGSSVSLGDMRYDHRTGTLSISASATDVNSVPHFVQQLRENGGFADIQYSGYTQSVRSVRSGSGADATTSEVTEYRYELTFLLNQPQAKLPTLPDASDNSNAADGASASGSDDADSPSGADADSAAGNADDTAVDPGLGG